MPKVRLPTSQKYPTQRIAARHSSGKPRTPKARKYPKSPPVAPPSNARIAAVDPGITTGMAFRIGPKLATLAVFTDDEVLNMLEGFEFVVIERFATAGRLSTPGLLTIELVGQIIGWCKCNKVPYELVTPQARWSFMSEAQGAVGGLIEPSAVAKHEVDSLAHLLAFEYRNSR